LNSRHTVTSGVGKSTADCGLQPPATKQQNSLAELAAALG
jgi:hypothetical protein